MNISLTLQWAKYIDISDRIEDLLNTYNEFPIEYREMFEFNLRLHRLLSDQKLILTQLIK